MAGVTRHHFARSQRGVASVGIAFLILLILAVALATALSMSGSAVRDAAMSEEQIAALLLAESGVERAQAIIKKAAQAGSYTDTTCTNLESVSPTTFTLGGRGGGFRYASAESNPTSCGGTNPACVFCTVKVVGSVGASFRTILAQLTSTLTQGVEGHGSSFTLNLTANQNGTGAITNLAYRAKDPSTGDSNAQVGTCTNSGGSCLVGTNGWNLQRVGTNNVSGMGVFADVPNSGAYSITTTLVQTGGGGSPPPAERNYVQTGALFYPSGGSVSFVGSYGSDTGSNKTTGTSSSSGSLPSGWTCNLNNGTTADVSRAAAGADTLVYGFSSWPASAANQLSGVTIGIQPLRQILNMTGTQGDNLYSQIWYAYNPTYFSPPTATNGANFTGTIGAIFSARISDNGNGTGTLTLNSNLNTNAILSAGDMVNCGSGCTTTIQSGSGTTPESTYIVSPARTVGTPTNMTATSTVLHVAGINPPTYAVLTQNDTITNTTESTIYGYLGVSVSCPSCSPGQSAYSLLQNPNGTSITPTQLNSGALLSSGATITLSSATSAPSPGTAVAVSSGIGQFDSARVTGSIDHTTLTVTAVGSGTLNVGDAISGGNIAPNTIITAFVSGIPGGAGAYTVNVSQTANSSVIVARAAVVSAPTPSPNSYAVSRKPTTRLSNSAQICGGVCTFFFGDSGSNTAFTLSNITTGDDWASGFACLSGVDPTRIQILGTIVSRLTSWTEPVQ